MSFDGDGNDSCDLDPFGGDDYDPSLAVAMAAAQQATSRYQDAQSLVDAHLAPSLALGNQIATFARHRAGQLLAQMRTGVAETMRACTEARTAGFGTPAEARAVAASVQSLYAVVELHDSLLIVAGAMVHPDLHVPVHQAVAPSQLDSPHVASQRIYTELTQWLAPRRGQQDGELAIVKATPGTGKTHQMLRVAYDEQQRRQRVVIAVRAKKIIVSAPGAPAAELIARAHKISPTGKVTLNVIVGRDDTNCYRHKTVAAVMAHGYSPGPTVCSKCDYYPDNARQIGLGTCPYYQERINANLISRAARYCRSRVYPIIVTTHASYGAATRSSGGRYGGFWAADLVLCDEDPTDSMETDVILTEEQCQFMSRGQDTVHAGVVAELFRNAIAFAREARAKAAGNRFRADDSNVPNSHDIHTEYDSAYVGLQLQSLLQRAYDKLQLTYNMPSLSGVLRDGTNSVGFRVEAGELVDVATVDEINAMDVPPHSLARVADRAHAEIDLAHSIRTAVYEAANGIAPPGAVAVDTLERETGIEPRSYVTRLECLPRSISKGRCADTWRFVVREFRPWTQHTANIIVGDAYAQVAHYEQLFDRPAHVIEAVATLHKDAVITRVLHDGCGIRRLREGGLQEILLYVEADLADHARPGDRVLLYGHSELRRMRLLSGWMDHVRMTYGLGAIEYEHWWGGRGKDEYNGWEHTYCISNPVQSLSGILHAANARAFRDSASARTVDERLHHARQLKIASMSHGIVNALQASPERVRLEHDRVNVAELTQAIHRSRPVHHPTRITIYGIMEQPPDLAAQTLSIAPATCRKERVAAAQRRQDRRTRQVVGAIDAFVTARECWWAVRGIIDYFGVYSPWFAHALVTARTALAEECAVHDERPRLVGEGGTMAAGAHCAEEDGVHGDSQDCDVDLGATGSAGPWVALPSLRSPLRRVWNPPVHWGLLRQNCSLPKAIRELHTALGERARGGELSVVKTARWPTWTKGVRGEHKPVVYYDPVLVKRPDTALAVYYDIVDTQYGPVVDGRLHRPQFRAEVPPCLKTLPF